MPQQVLILIILLAVTGGVALISYIIYRYLHPRLKSEKPSEEELLKEEMDRMLKPVDDQEVAKEIEEYKEDDE